MSEYTSTTSTTTRMGVRPVATTPVTPATLLEATYGGSLEFHKVRANGTTRRWPVLVPGSKERKVAEKAQRAYDKGAKVADLAAAANVSVATFRRSLTALAFTLELEGLSGKALKGLAKEANANGGVATEEREAKEAKRAAKAAKREAKEAKAAKAAPEEPVAEPKAPKALKAGKGTKANPGKGGFVATTKQGKRAVAAKAAKATPAAEQPAKAALTPEQVARKEARKARRAAARKAAN